MTEIAIACVVISLALLLNKYVFRFASSIFLTVFSSLIVVIVMLWSEQYPFLSPVLDFVESLDISWLVLNVLLGFLLFIGGMNFSSKELKKEKLWIIVMSVFWTLFSTFLVGVMMYYVSYYAGLWLWRRHCLLFGVIVSPTDPVAVIALLKKIGLNEHILAQIEGESLFNDGVSIVLFLLILSFVVGGWSLDLWHIGSLFLFEVWWGILLWWVLWLISHYLIKNSRDDSMLAIMIMLSVVLWWSELAHLFHVSWPLAMVVSWMILGNAIMKVDVSESVAVKVWFFWHMIDKILNSFIFLLVWFTMYYTITEGIVWYVFVAAIVIVLVARFLTVLLWGIFVKHHHLSHFQIVGLFTAGWLKGAISIALAMMLNIAHAETIVSLVWVVVLFSIVVQWLSLEWVVDMLSISDVEDDDEEWTWWSSPDWLDHSDWLVLPTMMQQQ